MPMPARPQTDTLRETVLDLDTLSAAVLRVSPIPLPRRIVKYELLQFLGGGQAWVFVAFDTVLRRRVAFKMLPLPGDIDNCASQRFLLEAQTASKISHPNVVKVFDYGHIDGKPFIVMELLQGKTLRQLLQTPSIKVRRKLRILLQIAKGLEELHGSGIIHRDVKPENIHVSNKGRVKILDLGLVRTEEQLLTLPGTVLGTPRYMAPEQVEGKVATKAVDIYSFGVVAFELLTGTPAYRCESIDALFYQIRHLALDLTMLTAAQVSSEIVSLIGKCTKKNPLERYLAFAEVVAELERALNAMETPVQPGGTSATTGEVAAPHNAGIATTPAWVKTTYEAALRAVRAPGRVQIAVIALALVSTAFSVPTSETAPLPRVLAKQFESSKTGAKSESDGGAEFASGATAVLTIWPASLLFTAAVGSAILPRPQSVIVSIPTGKQKTLVAYSSADWIRARVNKAGVLTVAVGAIGTIGEFCGNVEVRIEATEGHGAALPVCLRVVPRKLEVPPPKPRPVPAAPTDFDPPAIPAFTPPIKPFAEPLMPPIPPIPTAAKHIHLLSRPSGTLSIVGEIGTFVESNGHRFEGPVRLLEIEPCRPGADECYVKFQSSSSGRRERLAVSPRWASQLRDYLDASGTAAVRK